MQKAKSYGSLCICVVGIRFLQNIVLVAFKLSKLRLHIHTVAEMIQSKVHGSHTVPLLSNDLLMQSNTCCNTLLLICSVMKLFVLAVDEFLMPENVSKMNYNEQPKTY